MPKYGVSCLLRFSTLIWFSFFSFHAILIFLVPKVYLKLDTKFLIFLALPVYAPVEYKPASVEYPHNPVYNLVVPEYEHVQSTYAQEPDHVKPLAPPPKHHKSPENEIHHDPYLKTEAELAHKDFSGPFFYANTKKIVRKDKDKSVHNHNAYKIYY